MKDSPEATLADTENLYGLVVKSIQTVHDQADPTLSSRPNQDVLDENYAKQACETLRGTHNEDSEKQLEPLYLEFPPGDRRNPVNYSRKRKWLITITACGFTVLAAATSSAYNMGFGSMIPDLGCTQFQATIGLSVYALGFALIPLVSASFSEEFGRQPLYFASTIGFLLCHVGIALAKNIETVIVLRFFKGAFGSTGATMVGGTVADVWMPEERGLPMSIFAVSAVGSTGLGPVAAGWVAMNPHLQWRWIQWIFAIITGVYLFLVPTVMHETRTSIILTKLARKIRKETGNNRYRARAEDETASLRSLIWISCTRPIRLLITEPVVASFSLWIGFAWGIVYCLIASIGPVFEKLHGFNIGIVGTVFITMMIGSLLGFFVNMYQETLYKKTFATRGPEARLYAAMAAGILFPVGMFLYAWTAFAYIPWIAPIIGITIFMLAAFIIYLAAFTYLADCYGPFASSALAGQSMARNLGGFAFPLFTRQMFDALGYNVANSIFGAIAVVMMPLPFVLFFYGPKIRAKSTFSRAVIDMQTR